MRQLTLDQLTEQWSDVEAAVDATPGIDPWCSALDWTIPVATAFAPRGKRLLLQSSNGNGYVLLGYYRRDNLPFLGSIEPLWGFACPLFGPDVRALTAELAEYLAELPEWSMLVLNGFPPLPYLPTKTVRDGLGVLGPTVLTDGITRRVADLAGGYDCWLSERSSRFRRNLRQAKTRAKQQGVQILDVADDPTLFDRIHAIEQDSWKGQDGSGVTGPQMSIMYATMIDRLRGRQRLQAFVARLPASTASTATTVASGGPVDVGYILGGIRNRRYRGLQISFSSHHPGLSIGNLLQDHQLHHLTSNDLADSYDMGMDFPYKKRWADRGEKSVTLVVTRRIDGQGLS